MVQESCLNSSLCPFPSQQEGQREGRRQSLPLWALATAHPTVQFNHMATLIYKGDREVYFEQSCVQLKVGDPKKKSGNTGDHCQSLPHRCIVLGICPFNFVLNFNMVLFLSSVFGIHQSIAPTFLLHLTPTLRRNECPQLGTFLGLAESIYLILLAPCCARAQQNKES